MFATLRFWNSLEICSRSVIDHGLRVLRQRGTSPPPVYWAPVRNGSSGSVDEIATAIARCAGCLGESVATGESIDSAEGRAIHYGWRQPALLRALSTSYDASTVAEIASPNATMRNAVSEATRVPGRASRRRRSAHISHSCFAGFQHRSRSGSQLPVETHVLPFCSSHWSHK